MPLLSTRAVSRIAAAKPAQAAQTMPKWKAAVYTAGFTTVGVAGVWAGVSLKNDEDQRSAQKKLFQELQIEDDIDRRIALLEQRKARLNSIKEDVEKKAFKIQERINGKEQKQPQRIVSRQSVWKED